MEVLLDLMNAGVLALGALPPSAVPALAARGRRRAHPFRPGRLLLAREVTAVNKTRELSPWNGESANHGRTSPIERLRRTQGWTVFRLPSTP